MTPVSEDLAPDARRFVAHARWLLDEGCHGLVIFGTTGEANSFSVEERTPCCSTRRSPRACRPSLILVGTGCCALSDSLRLSRHALDQGVARAC